MARRFLNVVSEDDFIFFRLFALLSSVNRDSLTWVSGEVPCRRFLQLQFCFIRFRCGSCCSFGVCVWIRLWVLLAPPPSALGFVC